MNHPMAVRTHQLQIFEPRLRAVFKVRDRLRVVTLDKARPPLTVPGFKVKIARNASEFAVLF
jgi:hypothetical protein